MTLTLESSIFEHESQLEDPRVERTRQHQLLDIVAIAILAVISGADSCPALETFGLALLEWLEKFLALPNGIPSHETLARVFARLDPQQRKQCLGKWMENLAASVGGQVIAIDGKTLLGSFDRNAAQTGVHLLSARSWSCRLVLGQMKVAQKSNEITAIPELLKLLSISGCIITIDAMGCQQGDRDQHH